MAQTPRRVQMGIDHPDIHNGGPAQPRAGRMTPPPKPRGGFAGSNQPDDYLNDPALVQRLITSELEEWQHDLLPFYNDVNDAWAQWNLQPVDPTQNPFLSSVQSAYPTYAVEQILPRIVGQNPSMSYKAISDASDQLIATLLGKIATWQMQRMGFEYAARDFVRQGLVAKYSVGKLGWIRRSEERDTTSVEQHPIVADDPSFAGITTSVQVDGKTRVVVQNEPFFEVVNVLDFVWPLYAKSIMDARAVWQRRWITLGTLQEKAAEGVYQNIDKVTPSDANRWTQAYQPQFAAQGLSPSAPVSTTSDPGSPDVLIEVWERWTDDRLTTIASRRICIRDEPNPFDHKRKPFIDFTPIPRPFQMHGQSIIDTIQDSNDALSTLMRQVTDAVTYLIMPAFKSTEGVDWGNFVLQPGAHLDLPDTEDVQPLVMPPVNLGDALSWRQAHLEDMQKYSGVFDIMGGGIGSGFHTATGVTTVIQQATMRITEMINVLSYRSMRPFGFMLERLNAQYLDEGILVDFSDDPGAQAAWQKLKQQDQPVGVMAWARSVVTGKSTAEDEAGLPAGLVKIEPQMLRASGILDPVPQVGQDATVNTAQQKSDATQALQAIAPILASPQNPINMSELAGWMLKEMGMDPEIVAKVLQTPPVQQAAAVNAAQGGEPSPSGPSGDNAPTGGVVGAIGAAGPQGAFGQGSGR